MFRTHLIDGLIKLGLLFALILLLANIPFFEGKGFLLLFTIAFLSIILYVFIFRTLGSYLYAKWMLKMPLSWTQAKKLNEGLSPFSNHFMTWLPLKQVKNLDDDIKYKTAVELIERWKIENQNKKQEAFESFKSGSNLAKTLKFIYITYIVVCLLTSFFNLPPASYVIEWYCVYFGDDSYSPMFIWAIMMLPVLIIVLLLKKKYGFKF